MPGNDLTASRALVPTASDTRAVARANLTTLLTNILDDIEPSVTAAQININSDLSFLSGGVYSALTTATYVSFEDRSTDTAAVESIYVKSDELFYHDGAGNKVQLTSGGAAVAGASGDITGAGYGSTDVEIQWHAGTAEYRFKRGATSTDLADLVMDKARFSDGAGTDYATLGAQAAMSGVVDFSLPLAVPASTATMTMDSSGNMSASVTAAQTPHGDRVLMIHANAGVTIGVPGTNGSHTVAEWHADGVGDVIAFAIPVTAGDRIKSITYSASGGDGGSKVAQLRKSLISDGVGSVVETQTADTTTGFYSSTWDISDFTVTSDTLLTFNWSGNHANDEFYGLAITYDRP